MKHLIGNIQRFCLMDGPGIRTTVFTMGCNYRCPWCCNPEFLTREVKKGASGLTYGLELTDDEFVENVLRDKAYYENDGGVTFSGGEALLNIKEFEEVLKTLKTLGINICIETSLNAPNENMVFAINNINYWIVDFKVIDKRMSQAVLGYDSNNFLKNFDVLANNRIPYLARIPLAKEIIEETNLNKIKELFVRHKPQKIEIFKIHNLAEPKYKDLKMQSSYKFDIDNKMVAFVINYFASLNIPIQEIAI